MQWDSGGLTLTVQVEIGIIISPVVGGEALHIRQAVLAHNLREEVRDVTLTFHIGEYTISIRVWKRKNRHSAK